MSRPRIVFCYRYGLLGGVSSQLLNRYPYLSKVFDVAVMFEQDHGVASRFPAHAARVTPTPESRAAVLRELAPDVVVVIDSPAFIDAWRAAGTPGRLVLEVHTTTANLTYLRRSDRFAEVAHIVTVSSYMRRLLTEHGLTALAPITVIPNCLDDRWREPAIPKPWDGNPVVWVGKLDSHKRWRTAVDLIEALCDVPELSVIPLLIGGLTSPEPEVRALTTRLATSTSLARGVWWPRVEYDRMPALYSVVGASGGVHLSTTVNESFGMAIAESIVRGCPVVAPAVGALPELLPPAALYPPEDWSAARDRARRAMTDPSFRDELLATADDIRGLTGPDRVVDGYRAVVDDVLGAS